MIKSNQAARCGDNSVVLFIPAASAKEYGELVAVVQKRVDQVRVEISLDDREPSIYFPAEDKLYVGRAALRSLFEIQS